MIEKATQENAAQRKTYVGYVFDEGEKLRKKKILDELPENWAELHKNGHIHIHDLDAYGLTYNCLTFNIMNKFPFGDYEGLSDTRKILKIFEYYKNLISKVGNEQSGGMGFQNFDNETSEILENLGIELNEKNRELITESIFELIAWCNASHERMGQVSYYVTFNIGLAKNECAKFICERLIDEFKKSPADVIKPNIVFKVKKGVNYYESDKNHYLLKKALLCSAEKMIPTYLLCDCKSDVDIEPEKLSIMGCRTRVVNDLFGCIGSLGRGNIDNISINLPRLAFEVMEESHDETDEKKFELFKKYWLNVATTVTDILLDRYKETLKMEKTDFPTVSRYDLWIEDFSKENTLEDIFKHGTLSIGFIGLSDALEILTGKKYYLDKEIYNYAINFVKFMREYCDSCIVKHNLNFSLLATSGELISGRFPEIDSKIFKHKILEKGHYTNSFHVNVDSEVSVMDKISIEGPFHEYCNGGSITYIELGEAPIGNYQGLKEIISHAIDSGVHYLGFNFKKDVCNKCGSNGIFDVCPECGGRDIKRIRRVSGYLEVYDYFVDGKKNEVLHRRSNTND